MSSEHLKYLQAKWKCRQIELDILETRLKILRLELKLKRRKEEEYDTN